MNRLSTELKRLYLPHEQAALLPDHARQEPSLMGIEGSVRAMVVELQSGAGWNATAALWQRVQEELGLPAPAIAVNGRDGYQLWFSLAEATSVARAHDFLDRLRRHFLADIAPRHLRLLPHRAAGAHGPAEHARLVPFHLAATDRWSAFVSPDLAVLFAEEPWLDLPAGHDAQADLLARLASITPEGLQLALERLSAQPEHAGEERRPSSSTTRTPDDGSMPAMSARTGAQLDPRQFLLDVMNDPGIEMKLRIEAARALLPGSERVGHR